MPAKVFLTRIWPGWRVGMGWEVVYSKTEAGPVLGVRIAAIVEGIEVDIFRVLIFAWLGVE
jgi:hypothetical protein